MQLPVAVSWTGCTQLNGEKNFWCPSDVELQVDNPGNDVRSIHLRATFQAATGVPATLHFGPPVSRTIQIANGSEPFTFDVDARPGLSKIKLHSDATRLVVPGDPRVLIFSVLNLDIGGAGGVQQSR